MRGDLGIWGFGDLRNQLFPHFPISLFPYFPISHSKFRSPDRIPRDDNGEIANVFNIAPDWTIEILSPDQSQTKVTRNILHCLDHGTQLGWLIDPSEQSVLVYFPQQKPAFLAATTDILPVPQFAHVFQLTLGELFAWLLE